MVAGEDIWTAVSGLAGMAVSLWRQWGESVCRLCARIYALHFALGRGEEVESCLLILSCIPDNSDKTSELLVSF